MLLKHAVDKNVRYVLLHRPTDVHETTTAINIDWVPI